MTDRVRSPNNIEFAVSEDKKRERAEQKGRLVRDIERLCSNMFRDKQESASTVLTGHDPDLISETLSEMREDGWVVTDRTISSYATAVTVTTPELAGRKFVYR